MEPAVPMGMVTVLAASAYRQALVPMAAGYLILMAALAIGLRGLYSPRTAQPGSGEPGSGESGPGPAGARRRTGWAGVAWHVTGTVVGGYLLLLAVDVAYYYAVAKVGSEFLESAVTGTALLVGLALPVFAAASSLGWRLRQRRGRPGGNPPDPADPLPGRAAGLAGHPLLGYLAWAVVFGALFAWEGLALAGVSGVPSLSDAVRLIMRYPVGRWVLFAVWLWAGWQGFVRSWGFLVRARDPERPGADAATDRDVP